MMAEFATEKVQRGDQTSVEVLINIVSACTCFTSDRSFSYFHFFKNIFSEFHQGGIFTQTNWFISGRSSIFLWKLTMST